MDFVFTLHSHLPWVLHHGRWPHGSDWLCEAAVDTYLPLIECLDRLADQHVPAPLTIGVTPILANQLAHPDFAVELEAFFAQRLEACDAAARDFVASGEVHLLPHTGFWRVRLERLRHRFRELEGGIIGVLAAHARAGRIELLSSAATHGFLPLLRRNESIRLQLATGHAEHRRLFGQDPSGLWLPECAYRAGLEVPIGEAGFRFFFVDSHMAKAGRSLNLYGETDFPHGMREPARTALDEHYPRSPYRVVSDRIGRFGLGVRPRPGVHAPGLEPARGLSGRRRLPRIPQDPLARRPQALAGDRPRRRAGRQGAVRSERGARARAQARRRTTPRCSAGSTGPWSPPAAR